MKNTLFGFLLVITFAACSTPTSDKQKDFKRFIRHFQPIELPLDTGLLYRVYNSDVVTARIDTTMIQQFINSDYKLRINQRVHDGYGYAVQLPEEDTLLYKGLIHYLSKGYQQFFVLNTYTLDGELKSSLPISGVKNNHKRRTGYISKNRTIAIRESILHQPDSGAVEYIYQIEPDGTIEPLDTFFEQ